jgi:adenosylcobinamide-phosphate synthase
MNAVVLGCAYVMDLIVGDPEWFPHPVRAIGRLIRTGQSVARPGLSSPTMDLLNGALVTTAVVSITAGVAIVALGLSRRVHPHVALAAEIILTWTVLATGSLLSEAHRVLRALDDGDLPRARQRLSRIVGRDTQQLSESEISRALIETVAESSCDGIVAPLFYLVVGGVPGALAYKAVNTLDSMIGHPEAPYTYFGRIAARLDDVANFVPARVTALAIAGAAVLTGEDGAQALRVWRRDHGRHSSPNAGHPEAAMAGALRVTLGGTNFYDGAPSHKPQLGAGQPPPTAQAARRACRVALVASILTCAVAMLIEVTRGGR